MPEAFFLSEQDREILRSMLADFKHRNRNPQQRPNVPEELDWSPEVYIAYTRGEAVDGLDDQDTTGTGQTEDDDKPGWAICDIWRIVGYGDDAEMLRVGINKTVYNFATREIPKWTWIPVIRDKFGSWLFAAYGKRPSITVEGRHPTLGTQVYSDTDYIEFYGTPPDDGPFIVTPDPIEPQGVIVDIHDASILPEEHRGLLTNDNQRVTGVKTFQEVDVVAANSALEDDPTPAGGGVDTETFAVKWVYHGDSDGFNNSNGVMRLVVELPTLTIYNTDLRADAGVELNADDGRLGFVLGPFARIDEEDPGGNGYGPVGIDNSPRYGLATVVGGATVYTWGASGSGNQITVTGGIVTAIASATAVSITVGTTLVSSGTSGFILYNNAGTLGNASLTSLGTAAGGITLSVP